MCPPVRLGGRATRQASGVRRTPRQHSGDISASTCRTLATRQWRSLALVLKRDLQQVTPRGQLRRRTAFLVAASPPFPSPPSPPPFPSSSAIAACPPCGRRRLRQFGRLVVLSAARGTNPPSRWGGHEETVRDPTILSAHQGPVALDLGRRYGIAAGETFDHSSGPGGACSAVQGAGVDIGLSTAADKPRGSTDRQDTAQPIPATQFHGLPSRCVRAPMESLGNAWGRSPQGNKPRRPRNMRRMRWTFLHLRVPHC